MHHGFFDEHGSPAVVFQECGFGYIGDYFGQEDVNVYTWLAKKNHAPRRKKDTRSHDNTSTSPQLIDRQENVILKITALAVEVVVSNTFASTVMTVSFSNPTARWLDAEFEVPVPNGWVVCGLAVDVEGRMVDAVVVPHVRAQPVARTTRSAKQDAEEDAGDLEDTYRYHVPNIEPHGTCCVRVALAGVLPCTDDELVYQLPLRGPVGSYAVFVSVEAATVGRGRPRATQRGVKLELQKGVLVKTQDTSRKPRRKGRRRRKSNSSSGSGSGSGSRSESSAEDSGDDAPLRYVAQFSTHDRLDLAPLRLRVPAYSRQHVLLQRDATQGDNVFFCITDTVKMAEDGGEARPARICVLWDVSRGRALASKERELSVLRRLLKKIGTASVDVVLFGVVADPPVAFNVTKGNTAKMIAFLESVSYDGGTDFSCLPLHARLADVSVMTSELTEGPPYAFMLLFSLGRGTFQQALLPAQLEVRMYCLCADSHAVNASFLAGLASRSGGAYLPLFTNEAVGGAVRTILSPGLCLLGVAASNTHCRAEVYPATRERLAGGRFTVCGMFHDGVFDRETLTVHFGTGFTASDSVKYVLSKADVAAGKTAALVYALARLRALRYEEEARRELILRHALQFRLATPCTRFALFRKMDEFRDNERLPPPSLPTLRARYQQLHEVKTRARRDIQRQVATYLRMLWASRLRHLRIAVVDRWAEEEMAYFEEKLANRHPGSEDYDTDYARFRRIKQRESSSSSEEPPDDRIHSSDLSELSFAARATDHGTGSGGEVSGVANGGPRRGRRRKESGDSKSSNATEEEPWSPFWPSKSQGSEPSVDLAGVSAVSDSELGGTFRARIKRARAEQAVESSGPEREYESEFVAFKRSPPAPGYAEFRRGPLWGPRPAVNYMTEIVQTPAKHQYWKYLTLSQEKELCCSVVFHADCARYLFAHAPPHHDHAGLTVLSNVAALGASAADASVILVAAYMLEEQGFLEASLALYRKAAVLDDSRPESLLDVAAATAVVDYEAACGLLAQCWTAWYAEHGATLCALMAANRLLILAHARGIDLPLPFGPELVAFVDVDIRILVTWNVRGAGVKLFVRAPAGGADRTVTSSEHGPLEVFEKDALHGSYVISVEYAASAPGLVPARADAVRHPVYFKVSTYLHYARPRREKEFVSSFGLEPGSSHVVGTIRWSQAPRFNKGDRSASESGSSGESAAPRKRSTQRVRITTRDGGGSSSDSVGVGGDHPRDQRRSERYYERHRKAKMR